jgi:anti-sigma28 factor (negative regulator of flagellin synthesis)
MKIYDHNLTGTAPGAAGRPQDTQRAESARESRPGAQTGHDRVEFSGSLGALSRAVSADQAGRASRIHALTAQVHNGTYRPDTREISRGIIADGLAG